MRIVQDHKQNSKSILWDKTTTHANKFCYQGNFIAKIYGDQWHQLVGVQPLPSKGIVSIKATIKNYGNYKSCLCFGLLSEDMRMQKFSGGMFSSHSESVGCWTTNSILSQYKRGRIMRYGEVKADWEEKFYLNANENIIMIVNMDEMTVLWKSQRFSIKIQIVKNQKALRIFPFVVMEQNGDAIQIQKIDQQV